VSTGATVEEKTITPVEVSPEIIAQAAKLGYSVGDINHPPGASDHLYIKAREGRSPFALRSWFVFGPFATREEAHQHLPELMRCHPRAEKLTQNYRIVVEEKTWLVVHPSEQGAGPFDNPTAALDEAERLADEARRVREGMIEHARQEHVQAIQIPPAFAGINMDNFNAKTKTLKAASEEATLGRGDFNPMGRASKICGYAGLSARVRRR
jgi:hypothetical protein